MLPQRLCTRSDLDPEFGIAAPVFMAISRTATSAPSGAEVLDAAEGGAGARRRSPSGAVTVTVKRETTETADDLMSVCPRIWLRVAPQGHGVSA
jgi:hypothetical protein